VKVRSNLANLGFQITNPGNIPTVHGLKYGTAPTKSKVKTSIKEKRMKIETGISKTETYLTRNWMGAETRGLEIAFNHARRKIPKQAFHISCGEPEALKKKFNSWTKDYFPESISRINENLVIKTYENLNLCDPDWATKIAKFINLNVNWDLRTTIVIDPRRGHIFPKWERNDDGAKEFLYVLKDTLETPDCKLFFSMCHTSYAIGFGKLADFCAGRELLDGLFFPSTFNKY
jgi:hypothetical protein